MDKSNKSKVIISVVGVISLAVIVILSTYAWFKWRTTNDEIVNINLVGSSTITFYGGPNINAILEPSYDKEDGVSKTIRIKGDVSGSEFSLYLRLNELPEELQDASFVWAIYKGDEYIDGDNFENYSEEDVISLLLDEEIPTSDYDEYTLYLWIDAYQDNDYTMSGKRIDFDLYATGNAGAVNELD